MQFNMKPAFVKFAMKLSINASEQLMHLFSETILVLHFLSMWLECYSDLIWHKNLPLLIRSYGFHLAQFFSYFVLYHFCSLFSFT